MSRVIEAGLASTGDSLLNQDLIITGSVIWVNSVGGNDANAGTKELPLATLAQAVTNATENNGDMIILMSGHTQVLTVSQTIGKAGLKIYGLGSGSSAPNFTCNAAIDMFSITAINVEINNLYFQPSTTAIPTARIDVAAANVTIRDCHFLCGAFDQHSITLPATALTTTIDNCVFQISADGPIDAIIVESASVTGLTITNCVFDGDTFNWDTAALLSAFAHLNYFYSGCIFSNNAKLKHTAAAKGITSGLVVDQAGEVLL